MYRWFTHLKWWCSSSLFVRLPEGSPLIITHLQLETWLHGAFKTFVLFHNIWDNPSHWLIFFRGVGQPPTRNPSSCRNVQPRCFSIASCIVWCHPPSCAWASFFRRPLLKPPQTCHQRWKMSEKNGELWENHGKVWEMIGKSIIYLGVSGKIIELNAWSSSKHVWLPESKEDEPRWGPRWGIVWKWQQVDQTWLTPCK